MPESYHQQCILSGVPGACSFFTSGKYPARSCVEVSRLPKDVLIEIEAIAYKK